MVQMRESITVNFCWCGASPVSGLVDRGDSGSCGCGVAGVCASVDNVCVSLGGVVCEVG